MRSLARGLLTFVALLLLGGGGGGLLLAAGDSERLDGVSAAAEHQFGPSGAKAAETVAKPAAAGGLVAVGVVLLVGALRSGGGGRGRVPRPRPSGGGGGGAQGGPVPSRRAQKRIRREAESIREQEGAEQAGHYLIAQGLRQEAIEVFLKDSLFERAAEALQDENRFEEAADLFQRAGRHESAAVIYGQLNRFEDAAQCYREADKRSLAAEMYERAGDLLKAARCYKEIGFHRNAAETFLKAGRDAEAAEALIAIFNEEGIGKAAQGAGRQSELRQIATKASKLLARLGRTEEAERLLVRAGDYSAAAEMALATRAYDRAAELYQRVGRPDLAAEALKNSGDEEGAARLRGRWLRDRGEDAEAANLLRKGGEWADAADLYRKLERYEESAECYQKAGDHAAAAEMFRAGDMPDRASEAYERAGNLDLAAEISSATGDRERSAKLLDQAGRVFEAGRIYAELERPDDAIRLLQRVEPDDEHFSQAAALLGQQFRAKGMVTLAIKKLQEAVRDEPLSRRNIDGYYDLGRALEEHGDAGKAREIYERILTFDYHFGDVSDRLRSLGEAAASGGGPSTDAGSDATGRYQILRELGRGGMGVVYLARDSVLERDVALKVLPREIRESPTALRNFLREAKAAAKLNHPNIVTVYDAGKSEHGFYLAMEYVEGSTLRTILERRGSIPASGVVYVLRQVCDALAYAHRKRVVHRDIKTSNTMWTPTRTVKLMDFGLAKLLEEVRNATTMISGTPFYMSPEQTLGNTVDHRTDLYSLGVMTFEMATGKVPFRSGNVPYHHVHTAAPDPRELNPRVPEFLCRIIARCLKKEPAERYADAAEIVAELDAVQDAEGSA